MKTAGYTDKDLLLSLKRLCTEKNCFRDAKPDEAVLDYYSGTMKMVEEELANSSAVDADRVEAIVSNLLMVIGNAAAYFEDKSKDHRKDSITFVTMDIDYTKVCRFLDEGAKVTARFESAEAKQKNAVRADTPKRRKALKILKRCLLVLLTAGVLIFLSGFFFSDQPSQPVSGNIFTKIANWYKYDLRKEAVPVSFAEKWGRFSGETGYVTASVAGIWIVQAITSRIMQALSRRKRERIQQEWKDYQNLCDAFETASSQMNELEW